MANLITVEHLKNSIAYAINKAKERCGLAEVSHRLIANLSKGFQQFPRRKSTGILLACADWNVFLRQE
jgi:hypothetical protein